MNCVTVCTFLKFFNIDTYKLRHFAIHYKMDSVLSIIRPATYVKKKKYQCSDALSQFYILLMSSAFSVSLLILHQLKELCHVWYIDFFEILSRCAHAFYE